MRTGKRYGKTSLTARHGRDLARAIAECRYLLRELDPDGTHLAAERVGLITFKDCKAAMAGALGLPAHRTGHFWGMRGSNALEDCDVLRARRNADAPPRGRRPPGARLLPRGS